MHVLDCASSTVPSRIGALAGRYILTRLLGEDAAGAVFEGLDSAQNQPVLIKLLPKAVASDPVRQEQLQRLVERMAALDHPNIPSIVEAGIQEGVSYLVAKEVVATPLAQKMGQALDVEQIAGIISQVGEALVHAYREGLTHGHLCPKNVLIDAGGRVLLSDIGLESVLKTPWERVEEELAAYLAPERMLGREPDARADVYALGVMLFEMLTGLRPDGKAAQAFSWLQEIVPDLAPDLEPVLVRALTTDPRARYATVGEFMAELQPVLARYLSAAEPSGPAEALPDLAPVPPEAPELSAVPPPALIVAALEGIPTIPMPEPPPVPAFDWEAFISRSLIQVPLPEPPPTPEPPPLPEITVEGIELPLVSLSVFEGPELPAKDEVPEEVLSLEPPLAPPLPPPGRKPQKMPTPARSTARRVGEPQRSTPPMAKPSRSVPPQAQQAIRSQPPATVRGQSLRRRGVILILVGLLLILLTCCCGFFLLSGDLSDFGSGTVFLPYFSGCCLLLVGEGLSA